VTVAASQKFLIDRASPLLSVIALLGIPAAGFAALVFSLQIPRFIYGRADLLMFPAEIGSLIALFALLLMLRRCLALPSAPRGFYRHVLDFLALSRWHPAVKLTLIGLIVLPPALILRSEYWIVTMLLVRGRQALASGDIQDGLDRLVVSCQLALTGGVPLLFVLHMSTRWKPGNRLLPWLLVPFLFLGTAVAVVLIVTMVH
jgi:hypothetical protein